MVKAIKSCNSDASVVMVSCWGVNRPDDSWRQWWDAWSGGAYMHKLQSEKVLRKSQLPYIIIRMARLGKDDVRGQDEHVILNQHHGKKEYSVRILDSTRQNPTRRDTIRTPFTHTRNPHSHQLPSAHQS